MDEINVNQLPIEEESKIQPNQEINLQDEYPIIWYEPEIDSQKKKPLKTLVKEDCQINIFSEFREAFELVQSLGTSFLLIASDEIDEEKILQDFGALKDTYGRRYFEFEEEAVLINLFKDISDKRIKSLRVYVFYTRKDFENEAPVNEEEEEVMVMCNLKEMAKEFREEVTIIWCDPNPERKEVLANEFDIAEKNIFTNFEDLLKKLENYSELPYHLILSGKTKADIIVDRIDEFKGLINLYIYETSLVIEKKKSWKVKTGKTLEDLIPKITEGVRTKSVYKNTFPAFATQFDDWDKSHINKVHYYLRGFINFKNRRQAKGDFMDLAKKLYQSPKLFEFENEYDEYHKEQILKWYSAQSPIYKLINNCLRIATSDSILYCRYLLKDMEKAVREEHQQQSKNYSGLVYRGAYISKAEFEKLERNIGKEIEMYGFLSTTRNLKIARKFLHEDLENKVLITIIIPSVPLPGLDEQGFADLSKVSKFPKEEETLFNVRSRFQVLEVGKIPIDSSECRHLVLLYGAQLLRQDMTLENPTISLKFELPDQFECHHCESKSNLFATEKSHIVCKECLRTDSSLPKNTFLLPMNEKIEANQVNLEVKGRMLKIGTEAKSVYEKSYKCSGCLNSGKSSYFRWINLEKEEIIVECLDCFMKNKENMSGYLLLSEESDKVFWNKSQEKWEKVGVDFKSKELQKIEKSDEAYQVFDKVQEYHKYQEFCQVNLRKLARKMRREQEKNRMYDCLGASSETLNDSQKALFYLLRSLNIAESIHGESHKNTVNSYRNLAAAYYSLGDHQKALEYHLKCLDIGKFIHSESHSETAQSYNNLAVIYNNIGEFQKALEFHLSALEIRKSIFGEFHPETAMSYQNLASVYSSLGDYRKALEGHQKALDITKAIYGEFHPETADLYRHIATQYDHIRDDQKALEYNMKALDITKSIFGESHHRTEISYNNLGLVFLRLGDHEKALEYILKALNITRSIMGEHHQETGVGYSNLASVYESMGHYQKALEDHQRALEILKLVFGELHPSTANSYNNLALVLAHLGDHKKALECHLKALEIRKSVYGESHPQIAASYNNAASVYESLRDYQKALEYHRNALELRKSIYGEFHQETENSYKGLASVYEKLSDHQKALECRLNALEIRRLMNGESNLEIATSYGQIASAYFHQGCYQKALEVNLKALDITKSIEGEYHPSIVALYNNLALVYKKLGDDQKALEVHLKALEITKLIHGESHLNTGIIYNNIGLVYKNLKDEQKALEYYLHALDILKLEYGDMHPNIASLYFNIGLLYDSLGIDKKALEFHSSALETRKLFYEDLHPETATSYCYVGLVYGRLGDQQKALEYHLKAMNIRKSILGDFHLETATSYRYLASVYESLERYQNALPYRLKVVYAITSIFGESNPNTANSYNDLGLVYTKLGDHQKMLVCYLRAHNIIISMYGEYHLETANSHANLAVIYEELGDEEKTLEHFMKAAEIRESGSEGVIIENEEETKPNIDSQQEDQK